MLQYLFVGLLYFAVGGVIIDAINNPKPKLRYIVGKDAEEIIEASRKLPEQELFQKISQNILKGRG